MSKLLDSMTSNKWAMEPRYLQACAAYLLMRTHDRPLSENAESSFKRAFEDDGEPRVRTPSGPGYSIVDSVAVVPIGGTLYRYSSQINTRSGGRGASYEQVQNAIDGALANSKAKAILLHIDSPGGTVYGVEQTAMKIAQAKRVKPVHAFIDGKDVPSPADHPNGFSAVPSGFACMLDVHRANKKTVKKTFIGLII